MTGLINQFLGGPRAPASDFRRRMESPLFQMGVQMMANGGNRLRPVSLMEGVPQALDRSLYMQEMREAKEQKQSAKNKTLEWARINVPELAPLIDSGAMTAGDAYRMVHDRRNKRQVGEALSAAMPGIDPVLASQSPDLAYKVFQAQNPAQKLPTSVQEYQFAQQDPQYLDYQRQLAEAKSTKINNNMSVDQGKAAGFADRVSNSNRILLEVENEGRSFLNEKASEIPVVGNYLTTDAYKLYDQARRDFVNAVLRRESGAVISPSEFENAAQQYFPQPGDSPAVVEQKRKNRELVLRGLERAAGPGYVPPSLIPEQSAGSESVPDFSSMTDDQLRAIINGR
ncbi:MAG: hypothetical protein JJ902_04075 [Roseibium sp.]|nr:hypothetical protein [Roseibium sp.]